MFFLLKFILIIYFRSKKMRRKFISIPQLPYQNTFLKTLWFCLYNQLYALTVAYSSELINRDHLTKSWTETFNQWESEGLYQLFHVLALIFLDSMLQYIQLYLCGKISVKLKSLTFFLIDQTNRPCCLDIDFSCEDMAKMGF